MCCNKNPHLGIPPQLIIFGHGDNDISLDVEPGRPVNLTCQSEGEHAGNVKWTKQGKNIGAVIFINHPYNYVTGTQKPKEGVPDGDVPILLSEGFGYSRQSLVVGIGGIANGTYMYTCTAINSNENATTSIQVTLQIPGFKKKLW